MTPYWSSECGRAVVYVGDCREVMATLKPNQFHAVCADPPYELSFMSRAWDGTGVAYDKRTWQEVLRVAKPGAHLLSFGGTRTWHRMTCAIEDAGWEIRDTVMWVYGSGFPKGQNVSNAIDKLLGAERGRKPRGFVGQKDWREMEGRSDGQDTSPDDIPITDAAKQWDGWNTQLKPSYEPVVLARRPLSGSVAQNTLDHGCGGINVDGCRVGTEERYNPPAGNVAGGASLNLSVTGMPQDVKGRVAIGRHPANLIHDGSDEVVELFPETAATKPSGGDGKPLYTREQGWGFRRIPSSLSDQGGSAACFFYTAKSDASDRPHGKGAVSHPTVKPLDLMKYLVRLVCTKGGTLLDPFMGTGSTGCAALEEGMWFVGIEQSQEYADLAVGRLKKVLEACSQAVRLETGQKVRGKGETPPRPQKL